MLYSKRELRREVDLTTFQHFILDHFSIKMFNAQFYLVFFLSIFPFLKYCNLNLLTCEHKFKNAYNAKNIWIDIKIIISQANPVAKFLVPDWEDKVNSGIGLSCRPARLHRLAGRYNNSMQKSTISFNQEL
jgi:hypothetical protein